MNLISGLFQSFYPTRRTSAQSGGLSRRGEIKAEQGKGSSRVLKVLNDPYDSIQNPNGYVNLGVAEHYPMQHRVQNFINQNLRIDQRACSYGTGGTGSPRLKKAAAGLFNERFEPFEIVKQEHIQFSAGCGAICEMLGWNLAEAEDAILLSAPIYGAFTIDFSFKAGLQLVHVLTGEDDPVGPRAPHYYQSEIKRLKAAGVNPRILLICTPHNPLGKCYDRDTMIAFCNLAAEYDLHLVCDEAYALSVFSPPIAEAVPFTSILSVPPRSHSLPIERIHVIYSFSKDIAAAGLRLGCLVTRNQELQYAMGSMSPMHWSSSLSDTAVAQMLEDKEWLSSYIEESQRILSEHYHIAAGMLDQVGIEYYKGTGAAFFIWMDLSPYLPTSQDSKSGEELLSDKLFDAKVWMNAGKDFSSDKPGWFRIVFTQERETLVEGMKRLIAVVKDERTARKASLEVVRVDDTMLGA